MDIWTWLSLTDEGPQEADLGLIAEARRLGGEIGGGRVTVLAAGKDRDHCLPRLAEYGADAVIHLVSPHLSRYRGDLFCRAMMDVLATHPPGAVLFAHRSHTGDLAARIGAALDWPVITRAVDAHWNDQGRIRAKRPIANGFLYETMASAAPETALITFLPDVLPEPRPFQTEALEVRKFVPVLDPDPRAMQTVAVLEADPETLALEEADIVVAAGRGAGKAEVFALIHRLARALGALVGGTRPVIDAHLLPFERQIGQTGKSVAPRLIINCGISGANEYTAGMEKSQRVIAVNTDPRARIFRFADLGILGDVGAVLPLLVERLEKMAEKSK